jgi:proteasome lid subunit RPN8/RPN11
MLGIGFRAPAFVTGDMLMDAQKHFCEVWPREGVGFLGATGFKSVPNVSDDPENTFIIPPEAWTDYEADHGPVLAVLHSHPKTPPVPSSADMQGQIDSAVPWGILQSSAEGCSDPTWFGDQLEPLPLIGRQFVHGVADCYSMIRDWFWQEKGIRLPDYPRDAEWWHKGGDLYSAFFGHAGFSVVPGGIEAVQPGDVFLMKLRSKVINHGGVYTGDGLILHHIEGYLSHHVPLNLWGNHVEFWVRHKALADSPGTP